MEMNITDIRTDTRYCTDKLFMDSAGASLMPSVVVDKMKSYLDLEEQLGGYEAAKRMATECKKFYTETAILLNGKPENIAFTYNATDSFSRALSSIPFSENDYILTTDDDYISNQLAFLSFEKRFGIKILRARNLANGDLDLDDFEFRMNKYHPKLVAITHVPTNSGLIQPAEEIGRLCQKYNSWYILDACQSVGQLNVDVRKIGCDFMTVTGRKFLRGPRGTGFLYISDKVIDKRLKPLFIDSRGANWIEYNDYEVKMNAQRFENWECSYASLLGLKEAVKYANGIGIDRIENYNRKLSQQLRENLSQIDGIQLLDKGSELASIVSFHRHDVNLSNLQNFLKENMIFHSLSDKSSALIDFSKKGVDWAIRLSPHYFNTSEEIDRVSEIIAGSKISKE